MAGQRRHRGASALALLLALASACSERPQAAPPAELDTSVFGPAVRLQIDEARARAEAAPEDPEAQGDLGRVLHAYELHHPATAAYARAIELDPAVFRWRYLRGRALGSASRQAEAMEALMEALQLRSDYPPLRVALGNLLLEAGDSAAALAHYRDALRKDPRSTQALYGLAKALTAQGEADAAIEAYRSTLEQEPEFGAAHYALGILYRDRGETARATKHLGLAETHQRRKIRGHDVLMGSVIQLAGGAGKLTKAGVSLYAEGRRAEAMDKLLEAVELDPAFVPARVNLIKLYSDTGRYAEAEEHYQAAIAASPNAQQARFNYSRSLVQQQRVDEALAELRAVVEINPNLADAQVLLGSVLDDRGRSDEAEAHYRRALASKPSHPQANLMLALHSIRDGDLAAADGFSRRVLSSETESLPILVYRLAVAYSQAGQTEEAAEYYRKARQMASAAGRQKMVAEIDRRLEALN